MVTPEENLKTIIDEIKTKKIMLPDFQRQFDWDVDKQRGLIASVLTKLPVGGILLLKAPSDDYRSKQLGLDPNIEIGGQIPEKTYFLLDGQQRMTCLTNAFSDVIHEASEKKISRLASQRLLASRFYLKIDKWRVDLDESTDLFGIRTLDFHFDVSNREEPDFLTSDIIDSIECRQFYAKEYDRAPYMPCQKYTESLDDYCFSTDGVYMIPLFLLIGSDARDDKLRRKRLMAIVGQISNRIVESISTYHDNLQEEQKKNFAFTVILDQSEREEYCSSDDKDVVFKDIVEGKADLWEDFFKNYLYSCVEQIKLNKIEMPEGSRARAIDIYENMNMGGLSLSTLDLVAARVAKVSNRSLYERIRASLIQYKEYYLEGCSHTVISLIPEGYNASLAIGAVTSKDGVTKPCNALFLEVLGLYCKNYDYDPLKAKTDFSKSNTILRLNATDIDTSCEKVCIALDRTFAFLNLRCGVQSLSDVNYKLMIRVIAYIFTRDQWYKDEKVHALLEAWYWAAVFSGEYDKDQNSRFENNLKNLLESLSGRREHSVDWLRTMKENVLVTPYFSDCDFLLMQKADEDRVPKEHLSKYFCQFYLASPYSDLITDDTLVSVFSSDSLERHHIIPLGSVASIGESSDILRDDKTNIANSPLNYVYITSKTNGAISDKTLSEYENAITSQAKAALNIMNYPTVNDLKDSDKVKSWLEERHKIVKGVIQNRIVSLLSTF